MRLHEICLLVVCSCVSIVNISAQSRFCTTPNGETARCVPIRSCPKLYNAVSSQDRNQLKFLKESQCGRTREPLVCCGSYDNYHASESDYPFGDEAFSFGGNRRTPSWSSNDDETPNWGNTRNTGNHGGNNENWGNNNRGTNNGWFGGNTNTRKPSLWGSDDSNKRTNNFGNDRTSDEDRNSNNKRTNFGNDRTSSEDRWGSNERPQFNDRRSQGGSLPTRSNCGFQDADRILNGQATSLTEFPWMALLKYRKKNGNLVFSCGGTLISSRYVLTAAHCVKGQIVSKIGPLVNVRLGEYNTENEKDCTTQFNFQMCNDKPLDMEIEKVIVHPQYSDTSSDRYHDIALIKLKQEAPKTDFIKPICLPSENEKSRVGDRLVVAGWGRTENSNSSPVKLKLWVPIAERTQCSGKFRSAGVNIGDKQLCAGGEAGKDSCNGDSGGPLMGTTKNDSAQWYIEGIVSFGARCGSEGWPGIYTRVGEYLDWIRSNAN